MMDVEGSNLVTVSCAQHSRYVAMALRNLFDSKRGTDFNFRFGGESVRAHRLILDLFLAPELTRTAQDEQNFAPAIKSEVPDEANGSGINALDFVVEFLYKGEVAVPEQQLDDLLGVAKELDFQMLIDAVNFSRTADISEDELNCDTKSEMDYSENANEIAGLQESQIEDVKYNRETFQILGSKQLDVDHGLTLRPSSPNLGPQASVYRSTKTDINDLGHTSQDRIANSKRPQLQPKYDNLEADNGSEDSPSRSEDATEPLSDVFPSSSSDEEEDGDAVRDDSSYPGTSSNPSKKNTNNLRATMMCKCPHCDFKTPEYQRHVSHLRKIHGLTAKLKPAPTRKCPNCDFQTSVRQSYYNHCLSAHQLTSKGEPAPMHRCPKCDYSTVYSGSIKLHLSTVHSQERSHPCPQCSYTGKLKINLKQHLVTIHGVGGSLLTCKVCKKHFTSPSHLERHSRVHTNERPFKCLLCSYAAKLMGDLKSHMSIIHNEGDSCLTCDVCSKSCRSLAQLKLHSRVHTNERPFQCRLCSYAAKQMGNFKKHMRAIHGE